MASGKAIFFIGIILACTVDSFAKLGQLPDGISQHLYCESCLATVKELAKGLPKHSQPTESQVMNAVEGICVAKNFVSYEYSPPRTVKACKLLVERHEEEIENMFTVADIDKEQGICHDVSEACVGVDRSSKPEGLSDIDLTVDGKSDKVTKQVIVDPVTGKTTVGDSEAVKDKKGSSEEKKKSKSPSGSKKSKKSKNDKKSKTLSKKDKKAKKVKKTNKKEAAKKEKRPAGDGGIEHLNIDINDPSSLERVMQQIKEISKEHTDNLAKKDQKEEL